MPINLNLPIPQEDVPLYGMPEDAVADIPFAQGDYRFTGIRLTVNSDGNIVKPLYPVTQPVAWSHRALIGVDRVVLR